MGCSIRGIPLGWALGQTSSVDTSSGEGELEGLLGLRWFPPSVRRKEWRGAAAGVGPEHVGGGEGSPLPIPWHGRFNAGCSHSLGNARTSDSTPGLSVAATSYISWSPSSCGGSGCGHAWAVTVAALDDDDVASDVAEPLFLSLARLQVPGVGTDNLPLPARNIYFAFVLPRCSQALAVAREA